MKNRITFLLAGLIALSPLLLKAQASKYALTGKIGQLSAPAKAYLMYSNNTVRQVDSTLVMDGNFSFKGTIDEPIVAFLILNKKGTGVNTNDLSYLKLYLEPGNISVISPDSLENARVTGGTVNEDNNRIISAFKPLNLKIAAMDKLYNATTDEKRKSKEFSEEMAKRNDSLEKEEKVIYLTFIKANLNSLISLSALKGYGGSVPDVTEIEPLFNSLSPSVRSSKMGVNYAAEISKLKITAIGSVAPDFTQPDTSGNAISLHDFKGKYVLVDFWASWCGPCRAENPHVVAAYTQYKDKGFTVLGVSLDSKKANWLKAIQDDHLTWTQVSDLQFWKNEVAKSYGIRAIPQNFLVDPNGKIIGRNLLGPALTDKLKQLLDK